MAGANEPAPSDTMNLVRSRPKLGELLIAMGVLDAARLRKALDAQLQFEGRLGTNLLELSLITETQLAQALAQQHGVCGFDDADLHQLDPEAARQLPRRAAEHYAAVPLRWSSALGRPLLRVAMTDAGNLQAVDELSMVTGCKIEPVATPELRVAMLLERLYSIPRPKRLFVRIVSNEDEEIVPAANAAAGRHKAPSFDRDGDARPDKHVRVRFLTPPPPPPPRERATLGGPVLTEPELPEAKLPTPSGPAAAQLPREDRQTTTSSERPPESLERPVSAPLDVRFDSAAPPLLQKVSDAAEPELEWDFASASPADAEHPARLSREVTVEGGITAGDTAHATRHRLHVALEELSSIDDRDLAAQTVLGYLSTSFECALVLVVKGDVAYGWKGYAPATPQAMIESLVIPLATPSVFNEVFERGQPFKGPPIDAGQRIHARLWKLLSCEPPKEVLVAPVCVGPRLVNLIYAHASPTRRVRPVAQAHLVQLASAAALAYRRAIKRAASA